MVFAMGVIRSTPVLLGDNMKEYEEVILVYIKSGLYDNKMFSREEVY